MYVPRYNLETDVATLHGLIRAHPLGTWVTVGPEGPVANHVPVVLDPEPGPFGTLRCHLARANPAWRILADGGPVLVVFQGAEAYVTPSWYASKAEHGRVVPTWAYAVVHARGTARVVEDARWLRRHVAEMTDAFERPRPEPWAVSDAPEAYVDRLVRAIVGVELEVETLQGKWKAAQERSDADRSGVASGLTTEGAAGMAREVERAGASERTRAPERGHASRRT